MEKTVRTATSRTERLRVRALTHVTYCPRRCKAETVDCSQSLQKRKSSPVVTRNETDLNQVWLRMASTVQLPVGSTFPRGWRWRSNLLSGTCCSAMTGGWPLKTTGESRCGPTANAFQARGRCREGVAGRWHHENLRRSKEVIHAEQCPAAGQPRD
jgi:hypothetical protein